MVTIMARKKIHDRPGRPSLVKGEDTAKSSITLTQADLDWLRVYGLGNLSAGVRRLIEEEKKRGGGE